MWTTNGTFSFIKKKQSFNTANFTFLAELQEEHLMKLLEEVLKELQETFA